jgi:Xaa-Pro aminopeptidase
MERKDLQDSTGNTQGILVIGDGSSAALRHEIPIGVPDQMAYAELDGKRYAFSWAFEIARIRELDPSLEVLSFDDFGITDLLTETNSIDDSIAEAVSRACQQIGLRTAVTPSDFPLGAADALRRGGIELRVDAELFETRRRSKTAGEVAGIRRAVLAAEAGVAAICDRIASGEPVDCEQLRVAAWSTYPDHGAQPHDMLLVACGPPTAEPHAEGEGPIAPHQPILIDTLARDRDSGCWADYSRTVCLGDPPERLRKYHEDVLEAMLLASAAAGPGVRFSELNQIATRYLSEQGYPTRLTTEDGGLPTEGMVHDIGHGVGLEIHEPPFSMNESVLVPGDVITIEPGLYYEGFGGVRMEDMLLITEDGHEVLTVFPYDLELTRWGS